MPLIDDLFDKSYPAHNFICSPIVARGGVTLLHGKKSLGKSPFSWEFARCVTHRLDFLGLPTNQGKVLFIEKDTPEQLSMSRLVQLPEPRGGWWVEFMTQVVMDLPEQKGLGRLKGLEREEGPFDLVIWNPLARLYQGEGRDVAARTYDAMMGTFPYAGHLVISHDRKQGRDPKVVAIDSEEHSGWQEWVNLAQNVFRMTRQSNHLELRHTGSQVSALHEPIRFVLSYNNTSVELYERIPDIAALVDAAPGDTKREKVAHIAAITGRAIPTIWRALRDSKNYLNLSE